MDMQALRDEQRAKAVQVELADRWDTPSLIAGADVGFEQEGRSRGRRSPCCTILR